jgi:hypothetical protein
VSALLAKTFEIHVRGSVPPEAYEDFEYLTSTPIPASTMLRGRVPDQAALFGVLLRLQALGLELIEVRRIDPSRDP